MLQFNIKHNIDDAVRRLDNVQRKQIPFATSLAINNTLNKARPVLQKTMTKQLDNPTPFTQKGILYKKSTKRTLTGELYIQDTRRQYLKWQITGGSRRPRASREAVPVNVKLNKYGNIVGRKGGKIKKLIDKPNTFVGTVRGVYGLWERKRRRGGLVLLVRFESAVQYQRRFHFHETAFRYTRKIFESEFEKSLQRALKTAK